MIDIFPVQGSECRPFLPELAKLRIHVFREFPYLYDGDLDYEERYLADYFSSSDSVLVLARDTCTNTIVGASTAMPLDSADKSFQSTVSQAGLNTKAIHYFGESVLLAEFRGQGIGHRFFDIREAVAKESGFQTTAFCAVIRPNNHSSRPTNYCPHDAFWTKRGYQNFPNIRVLLDWREPGCKEEISHELSFWMRNF